MLKKNSMKVKNYLFITFIFFILTNSILGQINLGTASNFVLFTSVGAISNVGISNFDGNVGTNVGAITGFPPGIVTGQIHEADPTTIQAATDLENAYNFITSLPCDSVIGTSLGGGQTLTENVYCITAAAALNGELILDGENNPNALFIIKINGQFDAFSMSKVTLINSALIGNVYWQVNGAVNVGDSAVFKGVLLGNGALSFAQGSILDGNGMTRQGAISTTQIDATLPSDSAMPVELAYFGGHNDGNYNLLSWTTESEMNNNYFTLERSKDGCTFEELTIANGAGTCTSVSNYSYSDYNFDFTQNYYRLKQTDYDGFYKIIGFISINNTQISKEVLKIINLLGQEVDMYDLGFRIIHYTNGESIKVCGEYVHVK
jgi:hypothetical protein